MSTDLMHLQKSFQDYLLNQNNEILKEIIGDVMNPAEVRLHIYHEAYVLRLIEALQKDYPVLVKLLGDDFYSLSEKYIRSHPSTYRSIRWFGENFPAFLKKELGVNHDFYAELAEFERALSNAFDARNDPLITESDFHKIPPEKWAGITFRFHDSVQIRSLYWNVIPIWKTGNQSKCIKLEPKKYQRPQTWMLWRQELETYFTKLKSDEAAMLLAAKEGKPFGEICESLGQWVSGNRLILHAAGLLKSWVHKGLITAIEIN